MFVEELASNASRKRAEENRARRRRLKEQQVKRESSGFKVAATGTLSVAITETGATSLSVPVIAPAVETSSLTLKEAANQDATSTTLSAVERAQQQRELRAEVAQRNKAAKTIQSFFRSFRSNKLTRAQNQTVLVQRLNDLETLRALLVQKGLKDYSPPPATTSTLAQQLLFVTLTIPYKGKKRNTKADNKQLGLLEKLLAYCIVPGLQSSDDNLNPLAVWMQSQHGLLRLGRILRLSLIAAVSGPISVVDAAVAFLELLLSSDVSPHKSRQSLMRYTQSLLLRTTLSTRFEPPTTWIRLNESLPELPFVEHGTSMSIVAILRYYLMFLMSGSYPIPARAKELREKSFSVESRHRSGSMFLLVVNAINAVDSNRERQLLRVRIFTDIFTVPLLAWKLSPATVSQIVKKSDGTVLVGEILDALVAVHGETLSKGQLAVLLSDQDAPLKSCPATQSQCLLANLVQLCLLCSAVNCSDASELDIDLAALYFQILASVLDIVPVGTFSSRDSSIEWVTDGGGHHTPIVVAPVILDHCRLLLLDSLVRNLFQLAIDSDVLRTDHVIALKNDKDLKHEKDLLEAGTSAATLAAKEAQIDRSKAFWSSSKWAKKLTKGVSSLLSGDKFVENNGAGALMDTSTMSKQLAAGHLNVRARSGRMEPPPTSPTFTARYSTDLLYALCKAYSVVLARWGGGGQDDIIRQKKKAPTTQAGAIATYAPEMHVLSMLNVVCFSTNIVRASWAIIQSSSWATSDMNATVESENGSRAVRALSVRPSFTKMKKSEFAYGTGKALLYVFVCTLLHTLIVTDDVEIYEMDKPLPVHQLRRCIELLKKLLYRACCEDDISAALESNYFGLALISSSSRTMRDLYDRSSRRPMSVPTLWLVSDLLEKEIRQCKTQGDYVALLALPILRVCPFLVSFKRRLKIFERIATTNRIDVQGINDLNPFNTNPLQPGIPVRITRGRLLEDGLATMNHLGRNMRERIVVQYVNEAGVRESGVDVGGLFKEFWTDLSGIAFNPNYALFRVTDGAGNCLYPNPSSGAAHGPDHTTLFEFLGRILGKALYEGITIQPRFAHFFLSSLRGDYNYLHMLPDLSTVDPQLYNNLMFLKTYDGDAADLTLSFTVTVDEFGGTQEIPLMPNGANIDVTNANKQRYIGLVAKYYVVDRVKEQSEAFTKGLWDVIDRSWLRIFNEPELQVLISGATDGKIDVDDMRAHTRYVGGYTGLDRTISRFWSVVSSMDSKEQAELLRFVTSCERPPPLGFSSMNPPFTIQRVGINRDGNQLPTAATCFNTLKLPTYSSEKILKQRLLYAIQAGAGFELT